MKRSVLMAVDDDTLVLSSVLRDLRKQYAGEYSVIGAGSGREALDTVEELKRRGTDIAAFVVDERMPGMVGTEFLQAAREFYPEARRVLLTAYADTDAAIRAINEVGLDHYLIKPWHPPEETMYPVLDDLLGDWKAHRRRSTFDGLRVIAPRWSAAAHDIKDFLALNHVPYQFVDVERDAEADRLLAAIDPKPELPVVVFEDGDHLSRPGPQDIARKVGMHVEAAEPVYDLVIVGAGPAGLAAAVYAASEGLRVAVVERRASGGQAGTSSRIENYLGFPNGISGADLAQRAVAQALKFGAEIVTAAEAVSVELEEPMKAVTLADGGQLHGKSLLVASGMTVRKLSVPGYERLTGAGIYYGATVSEAASYRDEPVFIVGGANSAGQAALMFSRFASRVTLIVRAATLGARMSRYLVDQIEMTDNVEVLVESEVSEALGTDHLEGLVLTDHGTGESTTRDATGLFIFVGAVPHSGFVSDVVMMNEQGFILTGIDLIENGKPPADWPLARHPFYLETSVPGILAAGDVRHGAIRRVASAAGQGAISISFIHEYLETV